ncbi:SDR family NAD(P)-dependent oxidoreductase [Nibribacter ruber]|uniref:SDR family NAD(P)-dependent oxidoreductase n=1 Tax=Nibribacter ruber TaxID=2698458 RepID=A0A6P1NVF1_9BACT|nr:SDR family oxidoreductase [Nibribacter ruber]QHL86249.1 SDR family NAD(P)-dependent oxidoreductase [Nibribacter ruber]
MRPQKGRIFIFNPLLDKTSKKGSQTHQKSVVRLYSARPAFLSIMTDQYNAGKVMVVTGASSGIGLATTQALAQTGATVVLVCRHAGRAQEAMDQIMAKVPHAQLQLHLADLSSLEEVRRLAQDLQAAYPVIDVLVNNAGIIPGLRSTSKEGLETAWVINHLAPFLLTNLLMDNLLAAPQGRIINLTSEAHRLGQIDFAQLGNPKHYSAITAYADSKLANILFTYELARRVEFTNLTVNCVHPGVVATNFGKGSSGFVRALLFMGRLFMRTAAKGAETPVFLATSPSMATLSGKYFKDKKQIKSAVGTYNAHTARRLWEVSEEQTGF